MLGNQFVAVHACIKLAGVAHKSADSIICRNRAEEEAALKECARESSADTADIRDLAETGLLDGVTTNPSLIHKAGRDFVEVVTEMIDLISGQRAYEVNSRVIKAADEMLGQTAMLR